MKPRSLCALALAACLAAALLTGCAPSSAEELTPPNPSVQPLARDGGDSSPVTSFGLALMGEVSRNGQANPVLSPLSAYVALSMAAAGAATAPFALLDGLYQPIDYYLPVTLLVLPPVALLLLWWGILALIRRRKAQP